MTLVNASYRESLHIHENREQPPTLYLPFPSLEKNIFYTFYQSAAMSLFMKKLETTVFGFRKKGRGGGAPESYSQTSY